MVVTSHPYPAIERKLDPLQKVYFGRFRLRAKDETDYQPNDQYVAKRSGRDRAKISWTKKEIQSLMPANVFAARLIDAKTAQYCVNDVIHLPDLHALYLRRIEGDWLAMAMEESARRVADAHSPGYDPQSPTKKLGPWGSGTEKRAVTLDKMLEELEERRMEDLERDMFAYDDDVGYYDYGENDDWSMNAADGAFCPEALESY